MKRGGDFNINPHPQDWSPHAWDPIRHKLPKGIPPGCRDIDVQVYNDCVNAINGVNLCEYVIQDPKRRPRTHFANNFLRARNDGQRIDHVVVSREVVQKTASLKFIYLSHFTDFWSV